MINLNSENIKKLRKMGFEEKDDSHKFGVRVFTKMIRRKEIFIFLQIYTNYCVNSKRKNCNCCDVWLNESDQPALNDGVWIGKSNGKEIYTSADEPIEALFEKICECVDQNLRGVTNKLKNSLGVEIKKGEKHGGDQQ